MRDPNALYSVTYSIRELPYMNLAIRNEIVNYQGLQEIHIKAEKVIRVDPL